MLTCIAAVVATTGCIGFDDLASTQEEPVNGELITYDEVDADLEDWHQESGEYNDSYMNDSVRITDVDGDVVTVEGVIHESEAGKNLQLGNVYVKDGAVHADIVAEDPQGLAAQMLTDYQYELEINMAGHSTLHIHYEDGETYTLHP